MNRGGKPDGLNVEVNGVSRTSSTVDHASMSPVFSVATIPTVTPDPAYVAAAAASNIVSTEIQESAEWYEDEQGNSIGIVHASSGSLALINAFLDRLLYNFLACAHSTSLASLRPAVMDVLRPRLAREAIAGADEELQEYLGGDEEELATFHNGDDTPTEWDLDLVWKRTRLRCMVYTRLGDMEEEDEEMYIVQEHLEDTPQARRLSNIVSPAVAIFLTSILEFVGEHALMIAGQAAYKRWEMGLRNDKARTMQQKITVEESDMEKVALNSTLGRLWRSWRKMVRSPRSSISRIISRDRQHRTGSAASMHSSIATTESHAFDSEADARPSLAEVMLQPDPRSILLPSNDYDVDEIEVPGYSPHYVPKSFMKHINLRNRPHSMMYPSDMIILPDPSEAADQQDDGDNDLPAAVRSILTCRPINHGRANSLPLGPVSPFPWSFHEASAPEDEDSVASTPREGVESAENGKEASAAPSGDNTPRATDRDKNKMSGTMAERLNAFRKAHAEPTAAYHGSVLNAISQHAAKKLEAQGVKGSALNGLHAHPDEEGDEPSRVADHEIGDTALQFDQTDYQIDDSEHAAGSGSTVRSAESESAYRKQLLKPAAQRGSQQKREAPFSGSPRRRAANEPGDISPMEYSPAASGEVSPIEPGEEDRPFYGAGADLKQLPSSTLPQQADPRATPDDGSVLEARGTMPDPAVSPRPTPARVRRKEGPADAIASTEGKAEAIIKPDVPPIITTAKADVAAPVVQDEQLDGVAASKRIRAAGADKGAPTLTPLREMMEAAHDTSDEASSLAPSQSERYPPTSYGAKPPTSDSSVHSQPTSSYSTANTNAVDLRRQMPAVATATSANAKRESPLPGGLRESPVQLTDTIRETTASYSSNAPPPLASKSKRRVSPLPDEPKPAQLRSSVDAGRLAADEKNRKSSAISIAEREQSFEELIKSGETIQYTLTPQNMREIEGPDPQNRVNSTYSSAGSKVGSILRSGRTSMENPPKQATRHNSVSDVSGPRGSQSAKQPVSPASSASNGISLLKRGLQPLPRGARTDLDTTRDMADFIRSTGPEANKSLPKAPTESPSPRKINNNPPLRRPSEQQLASRPTSRPVSRLGTSSSRKSNRLQARDAKITASPETSALVEFIRQGPPPGFKIQDAPVRGKDSSSLGSAQDGGVAKSFQDSVNSRTALLDAPRTAPKPILVNKRSTPAFDDISPMPQRKQHRVKDPYAIPDSDDDMEEEDDDFATTPRGRKEESLLDFLNSVPPPTAGNSPPRITVSAQTAKNVQRRLSSAGMRSRFSKSSATSSAAATNSAKASSNSSARASATLGSAKAAGSSYGRSTNGTLSSTNLGVKPSFGRSSRGPQARSEANTSTSGDMREIADFLKNSGPPPGVTGMEAGMRAETALKEEEKGFKGMFRRKKALA